MSTFDFTVNTGRSPGGSTILDRLIDAIAKAFRKVDANPFVEARILAPQTIGITDTPVYHGLGRVPRGYFLVKAPSDLRIFDGVTPSKTPSATITLRLSAAAQVTVAVL